MRIFIAIFLPTVLTALGVHYGVFHSSKTIGATTHIFLAFVALFLYLRALFVLARCFNTVQASLAKFRARDWLSVLTGEYIKSGPYILRLSLVICLLMIPLNAYHIFTFSSETAPDLKNIVWRVAHICVAALLVFLGQEYKDIDKRARA